MPSSSDAATVGVPVAVVSSADLAEAVVPIRCVAGAWPLSSQQAQMLVLAAFPARHADVLHDAEPKAHTFAIEVTADGGLLRLTTLTRALSQAVLSELAGQVDLRFGAYELGSPVAVEATRHCDLAGIGRVAGRRIGLEARSPTRLGVGGDRPLPLPVPWALFAEPLKCWRAFAAECDQPQGDLPDWWRRHLTISALNIATRTLEVEGQAEPGFVGRFELTVTPGREFDIEWEWTRRLAQYARFTGVGRRRARGAGRLVEIGPSRA